MSEVVIYDPNSRNPYGRELASALASAGGWSVTHWAARVYDPAGVADVVVRSLPGPMGSAKKSVPIQIFRRLFAPIRVVLTARRSPLIVVWTADPWDGLMLWIRASVVGRVFVIYHNPRQIRPRRGLGGRIERSLMASAQVCVHSPWLAELAAEDYRSPAVTPHPPYAETTRQKPRWSEPLGGAGRKRVAFVGDLRHDKGVDDLVAIAEHSGGGWTLVCLGSQRLTSEIEARLQGADVWVEYPARGELTDDQLADGLLSVSVVLAPYRQVTESGSLHLVAALGTPILAYDSPASRLLLVSQSLANTPDELGALIRQFLLTPWPTYSGESRSRQSETAEAWRRVLVGE